ncbi:hypothetical protein BT69DRAFT_1264685 [Atractiella rhizophila]|nr:hypothetical protein BT69DRAFT_1264685 [Atractiella rhizophila]
MKATTLVSLSFLAAQTLALPILRPTPAPLPAKAKRQIGVSILSSFTLSGAEHLAHDSAAKAAAAAATGNPVLGVAGDGASGESTDSASAADSASESSSDSSSAAAEETSSSEESKATSSSKESKSEATSSSEAAGAKETSKSDNKGNDNKGNEKASDNSGNKSVEQDLVVLNFANTLERLETEFYKQGLETFSLSDMVKAGLTEAQATIIIQTLQTQRDDEATHSKVLESTIKALGGKVNTACNFDFSSVLTDPATFLVTARALEMVGVSAYSGGAQLVQNPSILTAAASILSIEARHSSLTNLFAGGNAVPQAFDIPLTPNSVLALALGFLKDCSAKDLGLTANTPLSVIAQETGTALIKQDSLLAFQADNLDANTDPKKTFCQMVFGGATEALVFPIDNCRVPKGFNGPVMLFITDSKTPLAGDAATQDQSIIVAGPAAIFVDTDVQDFEKLFSIHGVSIATLANLNAGELSRDSGKNSKDRKKVDIIGESKKKVQETYHNGMVYKHEKRGYTSPFGGKIIGWN